MVYLAINQCSRILLLQRGLFRILLLAVASITGLSEEQMLLKSSARSLSLIMSQDYILMYFQIKVTLS